MSDTRWLDTTKNHELRDALNFVGIPASADGATLATQQGTRGSPIVDVSCVPGLELYKVAATQGQGRTTGTGQNTALVNSGDYLWSSAGNLDLAFMIWNASQGSQGQGARQYTNRGLGCGILLRGDRTAEVQPDDVFGRAPYDMVLVSGTHAWRIRLTSTWVLSAGETRTAANGDSFNGWSALGASPAFYVGSQFLADTPLPFIVYQGLASTRISGNPRATFTAAPGGGNLLNILSANYATLRVYDFTLFTEQGAPVDATMPPSMSGRNTSSAEIPDPNDISQNVQNDSYWYINDAIVAPRSPRSIAVSSSWVSERTVASPATINIPDVLAAAFTQLPSSEPVAIGVSPQTISGATIAYSASNRSFQFASTTPGVYRVVFTAALSNEPGKRAEAVLTITVT